MEKTFECKVCGVTHTLPQWDRLELCRSTDAPDGELVIENDIYQFRQCQCGNTLCNEIIGGATKNDDTTGNKTVLPNRQNT